MASTKGSIKITAPVEMVFEFLTPEVLPEIQIFSEPRYLLAVQKAGRLVVI